MQNTSRRTFLRSSGAVAISTMGLRASAQTQTASSSSFKTRYPDMPRIESHAHVGSKPEMITRYHSLREMMLNRCGADLALWINLGNGGEVINDLDRVEDAGQGRLLSCISDFKPHDGLDIPPGALKD